MCKFCICTACVITASTGQSSVYTVYNKLFHNATTMIPIVWPTISGKFQALDCALYRYGPEFLLQIRSQIAPPKCKVKVSSVPYIRAIVVMCL